MQPDENTKAIPAFLIEYSDSEFTLPHEVVLPDDPKDCRDDFTHMGKKYWGLETSRHCATTVLADEQALSYDHDAHNWFRIGLKQRAEVHTVTISTKFYTGNQVRAVSAYLIDELTGDELQVLDRVPLNPDAEHEFAVTPAMATECLVECYYEGGISRVNFFGNVANDQLPERHNILEDAAITHVSNDHYGNPDMAVKGNRKEWHMVGWESARTGFGEQALFHLKDAVEIGGIVIDTYLHRLNPPLTGHVFALQDTGEPRSDKEIGKLMEQAPRWMLEFADGTEVIPEDFRGYMLEQDYLREEGVSEDERTRFKIRLHVPDDCPWAPLLPFAPLRADTYHRYGPDDLDPCGKVTHVLYMHYPNGGIHGLKMFAA